MGGRAMSRREGRALVLPKTMPSTIHHQQSQPLVQVGCGTGLKIGFSCVPGKLKLCTTRILSCAPRSAAREPCFALHEPFCRRASTDDAMSQN